MSAIFRFFNAILLCLFFSCWIFAQNTEGEIVLAQHPIFDAIENRDLSQLGLYISRGDWRDAVNENRQSPLYYAVVLGYADVVENLLKNGANPNDPIYLPIRNGSSSSLHSEATLFHYLIKNPTAKASDTAIFDLLFKYGKPKELEIINYIDQIKYNLNIGTRPLKTSRRSRSSSMASMDSLRDSIAITECPRIANFSLSQFDYLRTHIGSDAFEKCKFTWHVYGNARVFSFLVRQTLEQEMSRVARAALMEILWNPKPWLFPGELPRPIILAEIVNDLELILDRASLLRFLFVAQQALLQDSELSIHPILKSSSSSYTYREAATMQSALDRISTYMKKPRELAEIIYSQDRHNFLAISPLEFFRHVLNVEHSIAYAGNIGFGRGLKSLVSASIVSSLKSLEKTNSAKRKCDFWLKVAERLMELNDFFGAFYILSAIDGIEVTRLQITPNNEELHLQLREKLSNSNRYRKYRELRDELRLEKKPYIPLGGPEANDIASVGELGDEEESIGGLMRFNVDKNDLLFKLLSDHERNYQWLREQTAVSKIEIDLRLCQAIENFREQFVYLLSYSRKKFNASLGEKEILPLWGELELVQWGSESKKLSKIMQNAISNDLVDGLKIFHAYVEWKFASKAASSSKGSSRGSNWKNVLFNELEAHFDGGILESIKSFTQDEEKGTLFIGNSHEPSSSATMSDLANQRILAEKRWIIYLVKKDLVEEWFDMKKAKIDDVNSFIQWFRQFVDASTSQIEEGKVDRALESLGIIDWRKKAELKNVFEELTSKPKEEPS